MRGRTTAHERSAVYHYRRADVYQYHAAQADIFGDECALMHGQQYHVARAIMKLMPINAATFDIIAYKESSQGLISEEASAIESAIECHARPYLRL